MEKPFINQSNIPEALAFLGFIVIMIGLPLSKFLLSISPAFIGLAALWQLLEKRRREKLNVPIYVWPFMVLLMLCFLSYFYTENFDRWVGDVQGKLILGTMPLSIALCPILSRKAYYYILYCFILAISLTALLSFYYYLLDYEAITVAIGKNKAVDIVGNMHHSYFGMFQAFSILLAFDLYNRKSPIHFQGEQILLLIFAVLNFLLLHLFASRTGILSFYSGAFAYLLFQVTRNPQKNVFRGILLGIFLLPVISYYSLDSFKNRVDVSLWDFQQYFIEDRDLSEKSFSQRLLVWSSSWNLFKSSPIIGVGIADVEDELEKRAKFDQKRINQDFLLKSPHNQYLEYLAGYGLVGFLLLIITCIFPLLSIRPGFAALYAFIAIWMTAMMFESILERLVGISFVCTFLMTLPLFNQTDKTLEPRIPPDTTIFPHLKG